MVTSFWVRTPDLTEPDRVHIFRCATLSTAKAVLKFSVTEAKAQGYATNEGYQILDDLKTIPESEHEWCNKLERLTAKDLTAMLAAEGQPVHGKYGNCYDVVEE